MKRIAILPIMLIMFSLVVLAQPVPECTDGMVLNIQGGNSFDCHFTECANLTVDIAIDPWQNMTPSVREYNVSGCTNVAPFPAQSTPYPNTIKWTCPCTDDYNFTLTTDPLSNGTYYITFNQTVMEYWPVLNPVLNQSNLTALETELITITLSAYDNDTAQSNLSYSTDAAFGSMSGNVYTWQTDYASEGAYNITFFVTDGTYTNNETITLIVNHLDEPTPPSPPPDDEGTAGGGGGGGAAPFIFPPEETEEEVSEEVTEEIEEEALSEEETGPEATGLEGITGGAAGNLTEDNAGMGGITGAVIGALNKTAFKVIGSLFLLVLLMLLGLYIYDRRKKSKETPE